MKVIVIKVECHLDYEQSEAFKARCEKGVKDGLLILPEWCSAFVVDDVGGMEVKADE